MYCININKIAYVNQDNITKKLNSEDPGDIMELTLW